MDEVELLKRRLEREKLARKAAEVFIEEKSLELYYAHQKREQAFQALQAQTQAANVANAQLQQEINRRIQAETLERFLERIVQGHPLHAILGELAQIVEHQTSRGRCFITTQAGQQLFHARISERHTTVASAAANSSAMPSAATAGASSSAPSELHNNKQIQVVEDISQDPVWRPHWESGVLRGLNCCWSVPLVTADGQRVGEFAIHHAQTCTPEPSDIEWLLMLSGLAELAIGHRRLADSLDHQAHYDALTDLPNRLLFRERLNQAITQARRDDTHVGVLFLDLDGFKHINDTLGHQQGDNVLLEVTRRIQTVLRQNDTLARMGGDEFMLILPALKMPKNAARVAQKCMDALHAPMQLDSHEIYVSSSIGISIYPEDGEDAEQLQRNADAAMYRAKARGKNGFEFFTPDLTAESMEWLDLRSDLHHALENHQLSLHYQPQFRLDGALIGFEALLRWQHPRLGLVSPMRFIPIAEECGLILPIGDWVLREACQQMALWRHDGFADLVIAVNLSAVQLDQNDWMATVDQVLQQTGLPPNLLELELTESLVMQDARQTAARLACLRKLGVRFAIDDFGTGYSSLHYLNQLSVDTLKIDRSFVHEIDHGTATATSYPIIRTIIELGHSLGLQLIAEGVETEQQATLLRELGCDGMQGNLLAIPMPAEACGDLLRRTREAWLETQAGRCL